MCFSATASFLTAGVTAAAGAWCLTRTPSPRYVPYATIPIVFALQQAIEGVIWLKLDGVNVVASTDGLASMFLFIGEALWPLFIPFAALLIEPPGWRRTALIGLCVFGAVLTAAFAGLIRIASYEPQIVDNCIRYAGCIDTSPAWSFYPFGRTQAWSLGGLDWTVAPYALTTIGGLLVSSHARVRWFGSLAGIGLAGSLAMHRQALISVWCFFAALGSLAVVLQIEHARLALQSSAPD